MAQSTGASDQALAQRGQEETERQPFGPLKGKATLSPRYDNLGKIRPLGPGEFVSLDGGGMANEMSWTVEMGNNQWGVVPGLWVVNGIPTHVPAPIAQQYARQSNLNWPTFGSEEDANKWAEQREAIWEKTPHGRTDMQQPLWSRKWPPPSN
jgi:hypothetical protein